MAAFIKVGGAEPSGRTILLDVEEGFSMLLSTDLTDGLSFVGFAERDWKYGFQNALLSGDGKLSVMTGCETGVDELHFSGNSFGNPCSSWPKCCCKVAVR
jgi:hypothetical protein